METPRRSSPSRRTTPLPPGWQTRIRPPILERDGHRCTWTEHDGERCTERATDVDHIGDPTDHSPENLRSLCGYHHRKRTAIQANAAKGPPPSRRRPPEAHPGLINTKSDSPLEAARKKARKIPDIPGF